MQAPRHTRTGVFIAALCLTPAGFGHAGSIAEQDGIQTFPAQTAGALRPAATVRGAPTAAQLVIKVGDMPIAGLPVTVLNTPFTNDTGQFGFVGAVNNGGGNEHFVWFDGNVVWRNSDAIGHVLAGGEGTMGISDAGGFIYSPSAGGLDSVWSHNGLLAVRGEPAPGFPAGAVTTFHSRPTMSANGIAHWVAGVHLSGGTATQERVLYAASDATPATITPVLRSGELVNGFPIAGANGIDFDYWVSGNGSQRIVVLQLVTGSSANDIVVWVNGQVVAQESAPTGDGDNWAGLDSVAINNAGDYLFSGDTDGPVATDEFIAYNGTIAIREGDTLDGVTLASGAAVQAVSINDLGQAAHIWSHASGDHLFVACDAADLAGSIRLLSTGDTLDFDEDGIADATVTDLNASGAISPGLDLAEDGRIALNVDLDFGTGGQVAIVALAMPACAGDVIFADGFETPPAP